MNIFVRFTKYILLTIVPIFTIYNKMISKDICIIMPIKINQIMYVIIIVYILYMITIYYLISYMHF